MNIRNQPLDFLTDNPNLDLCAICGEKKKLTFEHMPPKRSNNSSPVNIVGLENMTPLGGFMHNQSKKSPKGFGKYSLCEACNKLTGAWYAESYISYADQTTNFIKENLGTNSKVFECSIKPLNFLKQVVSLLLSADQATGVLREEVQKTNFILDKETQDLSNNIFLSMSITPQREYRLKGFSTIWDSKNGVTSNIEFIYFPFHFRCAFDKKEMMPDSVDLIDFKNFKYNEEIRMNFTVDLSGYKNIENEQ